MHSTYLAPVNAEAADNELIAALADHNIDALSYLYDRYSPLIYSLAFQIVSCDQAAEVITHEIFLELWHRSKLYDPHQGSLRSVLIMVTRARSLSWLQQTPARHYPFPSDPLAPLCPIPTGPTSTGPTSTGPTSNHCPNSAQAQTIRPLIHKALQQLSPETQAILASLYYKGNNSRTIAQQNSLSVGTVELRSRQALKTLRQTLHPLL